MSQYRDGSEVESFSRTYRAVVERYEERSDQCTIFPADASEDNRMTRWITAEAPAYVHLADYR